MTPNEKKSLTLLGVVGLVAFLVVGYSLLNDLFTAQQQEIRRVEQQIAQYRLQTQRPVEAALGKKIAALEKDLWPQGSITSMDLGDRIRRFARDSGLEILGGRLRSETKNGSFWEWQLRGSPGSFFRMLDRLEALEHPLLFRSLELRQDQDQWRITLEVGYGLKT